MLSEASSSPTATPAPDVSPLCRATFDYFIKSDAVLDYAIVAFKDRTVSTVSESERLGFRRVIDAALAVTIPAPPSGAPNAEKMYTAVRLHQASMDQMYTDLLRKDASALSASLNAQEAARRDVDAYHKQLC